jgi:hypothetical protein
MQLRPLLVALLLPWRPLLVALLLPWRPLMAALLRLPQMHLLLVALPLPLLRLSQMRPLLVALHPLKLQWKVDASAVTTGVVTGACVVVMQMLLLQVELVALLQVAAR